MERVDCGEDAWEDCPRGAFERFAHRLRCRRQCRQRVRAGSAVAVLLLLVGGLTWAFLPAGDEAGPAPAVVADRPAEPDPSPEADAVVRLSCRQVIELAETYRTGDLDDERVLAIKAHLERCPSCRDEYRELGITRLRRLLDRHATQEEGVVSAPAAR